MVLTRRQEALLNTPRAAAQQQEQQQTPAVNGDSHPSPATPQDAVANRTGRAPLKSALKPQLGPGGLRQSEAGGNGEATPAGATIKKRVRIHSQDNVVHEFHASLNTEELPDTPAGSDTEGEGGTQLTSRAARRRSAGQRHAGSLPRYRQFILGATQDMRGSNTNSSSSKLGILFTLGWMVASSALIFANKVLMVDYEFRYPCALTALGQLVSMLLAWLACQVGLAPLGPRPSLRTALTKLLPISASFAASLFLGNVAYLGLSVAFINIMKAATPLVTLLLGLSMRLEHPSKLTLVGTALIALGTALTTAAEAGTGHFQWLFFIAFATSVVFEGIRVVLTEILLGQSRYNVMEALVYLGPFTFLLLAGGAYMFEWQGLSTQGLAVFLHCPQKFAVAMLMSFLVNLLCYLAIRHVSATSFKVAGCLKNVLVVWLGILQGDLVSERELQGYGISLVGFVLFSTAKLVIHRSGMGRSADSQAARRRR